MKYSHPISEAGLKKGGQRNSQGDLGHYYYGLPSKLYGNLWTTHPPFQIDCNFGYAAGVNEMLVQSHMGYIHLLPALPKAWSTGSVKGLRVRGGYELDMEWKDGALTQAVLRGVANGPGQAEVRYGTGTTTFTLAQGESRVLRAADFASTDADSRFAEKKNPTW